MIADSVKAQTVWNVWYTKVAQPILSADARVAAIRAAITSNSLAGEFTEPELAAMLAVETALNALASLPGVATAEGKHRMNHNEEQDTVGLEV